VIRPQVKFELRLPEKPGVPRRASGARTLLFRVISGATFPAFDVAKLWDVTNVISLSEELDRNAMILDCGAFNSPSLPALATRGFSSLYGIDINPSVVLLPDYGKVTYTVQNMEHTAFETGVFDFVFSASTIEHGVSLEGFLAEARRLLKPGGSLYISTDIVHENAETSSIMAFGSQWTPLRPSRVLSVCDLIERAGFLRPSMPDGFELPLDLPHSFMSVPLGFVGFFTARTC
jgi:SAM-dependent methyltransferase